MPPPAAPSWTRELPLLAGILLGWLGLWWKGGAFVLDRQVRGYHWPDWLFGAWNHAHGHTHMLDPFRRPLHSALVGGLSEWLGLLDAALLVSGLSMLVVVISTGLTLRLLVGPWAGALGAAAVAWSPVATSGVRWGTAYPLLTGAVALGIAASVAALQRPRPGLLILASGSVALATMADDRGLLLVLVLLPLLAVRALRTWGGRLLLLGVLLGAGAGPLSAPWLGQPHSLSAEEKRQVQTRVVARWTTRSQNQQMVEACRPLPESTLLTPAFLTTPCAPAVLQHNLAQTLPGTSAWPIGLLGLALLALIEPRRWRTDPDAPLLALGVLLATLASAVWTPLPARYQLVYTALTGLLLPLAVGWRLKTRPRGLAAIGGGLFGLVVLLDPHHHDRHPVKGIDARWGQPAEVAALVRRNLAPSVPVRDCANTYAELALLPDHSTPMGPALSVPDARPCHHWLAGDAPRALLVRPGLTLSSDTGPVDLSSTVAATPGWTRLDDGAGVQLWVKR